MAELFFCKGGDRNFGEVPEVETCEKLGIQMVDGLGEKIRSSSEYTGLKQLPDSALDFPTDEQLEKARKSGLIEV